MVTIKFHYNERIISGILLGKYQRPHDEVYSVKKRFLWKTKIIYKHKTLNTPLYLIFIPWRHQEKELIEVDEKYIINPETIQMDETWINVDKFTSERSESVENHTWNESLEVNKFIGYKFIYENNDFLINVCLNDWWEPLTIIYQNIPQLLNMDLDNKEE
jgi:hypothetical protein